MKGSGALKKAFRRTIHRKRPHAQNVVVSFPKSGRTWLRVMLDSLEVEADYTHDGSSHNRGANYTELTPDKSQFADANVVLLVRDPRDVVVSGFHQASKRTGVFSGTLAEFIRSENHGVVKVVAFYRCWFQSLSSPKTMLVVRYEDLRKAPEIELQKILAHFGAADLESSRISDTVQGFQFDLMRKMEADGTLAAKYGNILTPKDPEDPSSYKVRKGKVGGYSDEMSSEDVSYCSDVMRDQNCPWYL